MTDSTTRLSSASRPLSFFDCLTHPKSCPNHFKPSSWERLLNISVAAITVIFGAMGAKSETPAPFFGLASLSLVVALVLRRYYHHKNIQPVQKLTQGKQRQKDKPLPPPPLKLLPNVSTPEPLPTISSNSPSSSSSSSSSCPSRQLSPPPPKVPTLEPLPTISSNSASSSSSSSSSCPTVSSQINSTNVIDRTLSEVWIILEQCMTRIETQLAKDPVHVGIFRTSAPNQSIEEFMTLFNNKEQTKKKSLSKELAKLLPRGRSQDSVRTISPRDRTLMQLQSQTAISDFLPCLLKRILQNSALIPEAIQPAFIAAGQDIQPGCDRSAILTQIRQAIEKLPPENRSILAEVIRFFQRVSTYHKTTQMPADNLAIVLGPNILPAKNFEDAALCNAVTQFMIENAEELFAT